MLLVALFSCSLFYFSSAALLCEKDYAIGPPFGDTCPPDFVLTEDGECCQKDKTYQGTPPPSTTTMPETTIVTDGVGSTVVVTVTEATTVTTTAAPQTSEDSYSSSSGSGTCVDKVNPSTGISDCPASAYLCNRSGYVNLMKEQCPKTCGYCSTDSSSSSGSCMDKINPRTGVSDCPASAYLCTNTNYASIMKEQCPKTCGLCSSSGTASGSTGSSSSCLDLVNPKTGVSDCPSLAYLCNDSNYATLMITQCPKTCDKCSSSESSAGTVTTVSNSRTCADQVNPATGVSDCPRRRSLCSNSAYASLMRSQCPVTCGFC